MKWVESASESLCDRGAENIIFGDGRYKFDLWGAKFDSVFDPKTTGFKFFEHVYFIIEAYDFQVKEVRVDSDAAVAKGFLPFDDTNTLALTTTFCYCGAISKKFEKKIQGVPDAPHSKDCLKSS